MDIAICIGCGCSDRRACHHPSGSACWWLVVDYEVGFGVCSCCKDHLARWEAGERSLLMVVAKIIKEGEAEPEPYYLERQAMDQFPYALGASIGDKFIIEWVGMTVQQFEALPQFEHVRLAQQWQEAYGAAMAAEAKGLVDEAQKHHAEAVRLAAEIQQLGFDVLDLVDGGEELSLML